jgi:uncharacterized membrane protein
MVMLKKNVRLFCLTIASYALMNSISVPRIDFVPEALQFDQAAFARRSGGRSSGGSFNRSRPNNSGSQRSSGSDNNGGGSVVVPGGGYYGGGYYGGGAASSLLLPILAFILIGGAGFFVWYLIKSNKPKAGNEIDNDTVTVTNVQVGLLAEGRAIQAQLAEIVQNSNTETPEGLHAELQEAVLALLRMPENWSHVRTSSETVKSREEGERKFKALSIAERTKYTEETLSNVGGKIVHKDYTLDPDKDPASYIVVTLLIGTADDKPLFSDIRTTEALTEVLQKLASLNSDYLFVFELLWTPEAEGDSLTYDEMLTEYPDMLQI